MPLESMGWTYVFRTSGPFWRGCGNPGPDRGRDHHLRRNHAVRLPPRRVVHDLDRLQRGLFGYSAVWDPYPFGLLTMIVSLEAIFLSTFVMVSQNRQAIREKVRADLDFETNIRSEVWSAHIGHALESTPSRSNRRCRPSSRRTRRS